MTLWPPQPACQRGVFLGATQSEPAGRLVNPSHRLRERPFQKRFEGERQDEAPVRVIVNAGKIDAKIPGIDLDRLLQPEPIREELNAEDGGGFADPFNRSLGNLREVPFL